jgi:hypothetical protein
MSKKKQKPLTVEELGKIGTCHNCNCQTFTPKAANDGRQLPKGFTMGNRQMAVRVRGIVLHVCQNCRYNVYERY